MASGSVSDGEACFAQLDLSGKLIIKANLGDYYRRITIHNDDITYEELILMMQRLFRGKIDVNDDVQLTYKDEDGDLIAMEDNTDLKNAIQSSRFLKITITLNGKDDVDVDDTLRSLREELTSVTNKLDRLIGCMELKHAVRKADGDGELIADRSDQQQQHQQQHRVMNKLGETPNEFDPLNDSNKLDQVSSRGTPSSMNRSVGDIGDEQPATIQPSVQHHISSGDSHPKFNIPPISGPPPMLQVCPPMPQGPPPQSGPRPQQPPPSMYNQQQMQQQPPQGPPQHLPQQPPQHPPQQPQQQPNYGPPPQSGPRPQQPPPSMYNQQQQQQQMPQPPPQQQPNYGPPPQSGPRPQQPPPSIYNQQQQQQPQQQPPPQQQQQQQPPPQQQPNYGPGPGINPMQAMNPNMGPPPTMSPNMGPPPTMNPNMGPPPTNSNPSFFSSYYAKPTSRYRYPPSN